MMNAPLPRISTLRARRAFPRAVAPASPSPQVLARLWRSIDADAAAN
ncbi:MAG TPA: hypothetical protein VGC42_16950 [Kofleriaceae bacterium]